MSAASPVIAFLNAQPMFTGLVGAALTGGLLYFARALPMAIWRRIRALFSVTLVLEEREEAFAHIAAWLARHEAVRRARTLMVAQTYDYSEQRWEWSITLGQGWHLLRYHGAWMFVCREIKEGGELSRALGSGQNQRLHMITLGRSQAAMRSLVARAKADYYGDELVNVHIYDGGWMRADCRRPRSLDTVFMPAAQKARLVEDFKRFAGARDTYRQRGIPWRRGYMFAGPPGTGKTTMIFALAGLFGRPIYVLNLASLTSDNQLMSALNQVSGDGVVVIEDIDTIRVSQDRAVAPETSAIVLAPEGQPTRGVTLSGLLNAIDGLGAREGRVLFITSNHAERLDPALVRPGRIDLVEEIGPLGRDDALAMVEAFGASADVIDKLALPIAAASLQGLLLSAVGTSQAAAPTLRIVSEGEAA